MNKQFIRHCLQVTLRSSGIAPLPPPETDEEKAKKAAKKKRRTSSSVSVKSTDTESTGLSYIDFVRPLVIY